jgi:tungstate transport system substrate-binding protein
LIAATLLGNIAASSAASDKQDRYLLLGATTTTDHTGFLAHILDRFKDAIGIDVRPVVRGTGQVIRLAENGDVDALLVHHPESEKRLVAEGFGVARHVVMYNDFVIIGPKSDPARVADSTNARSAFRMIAESRSDFLSRADDSGTHKKEREIWRTAGIDPDKWSGGWYRETGSGMGATINMAAATGAYTLVDRGSWLAFRNKRDLALLHEGDAALLNVYAVIRVNPRLHPHVRSEEGQSFVDWLLSDEGRAAISSFRIDGQQLFYPWDGD